VFGLLFALIDHSRSELLAKAIRGQLVSASAAMSVRCGAVFNQLLASIHQKRFLSNVAAPRDWGAAIRAPYR
jgi:hypothetical protein